MSWSCLFDRVGVENVRWWRTDDRVMSTRRVIATSDGIDAESRTALDDRRHLLSVAFRMLGTMAEAEDAVQETYLRWYRLDETRRDAIKVPRAWLTTTVSRVCLTRLTSAPRRRELYVGEWLPEPVPAFALTAAEPADPADRIALDESVSTALLVVMETMTPAERVAFVLHDVFAVPFEDVAEILDRSSAAARQLATSARRRIREDRGSPAPRAEHDRVVRAFTAAARAGDLAGLVAILDPHVVLRSDGGGVVSAARRPVSGADQVARFLVGIATQNPSVTAREKMTPGGLGHALVDSGRVIGFLEMTVVDGAVVDVRLMMNPAKLTLWQDVAAV